MAGSVIRENKMTLTGIFGNIGSGKTLLATMLAMYYADFPNVRVYTNFKVEHPNIELINPVKFVDLALHNEKHVKYLVFLDEVYGWLDSRCSASHVNRLLDIIGLQSRKRNMDIFYIAQLGSSVDLRYRDITDYIFLCEKIPYHGFYYTLRWRTWRKVYEKKFFLPLHMAQQFWRYYDTTEIVKPIGLGKLYQKLLELEQEDSGLIAMQKKKKKT